MKEILNIKGKFLSQYQMASPKTVDKYNHDLNYFFEGCGIETCEDLKNFNEEKLEGFYTIAKNKAWKVSTINSLLLTWKIFLNWCRKKGYCSYDSRDIKLAKNDNRVHFTPKSEEVEKFLEYIGREKIKSRFYVMVKLLLNSGLRRFEICNLKINDIDFDNNIINVKGKGNKTIPQPVKAEILEDIKNYIEGERKETMAKYISLGGKDLGYVFVSNIGTGKSKDLTNGDKVQEIAFYNQIKNQAKKAGVKDAEEWTTHAFRRKYVTTIYEKTGDVFLAQKAARHNSSETTMKCYIDFDQQRLRSVVDAL